MKTRKLTTFSRTCGSLSLSLLGALSLSFAPASFQAVSAATLAAEGDTAATQPAAPHHYSAGVEEILKMVDAKVDPEVIAAYVKNSTVAYNPSASEIIALRARGVPNEVIVAMIQRGGELRARTMQANIPYPPPSATTPYAPGPTYQNPPASEQPANPGYTYVEPSYQSYTYPTYSYSYPYYSGYGYPYYSGYYGYPYYGSSFGFSIGFGWPFYGYCGYPYRYGYGYCGYPYRYGYCGYAYGYHYPYSSAYHYPYSSAYHYPYNNGHYYYGGSSAVHNGTWTAQSAAFRGSSAVRFGSAGHPTSSMGGGASMGHTTFGSMRAASSGGAGFHGGGGGGGFHGGGGGGGHR